MKFLHYVIGYVGCDLPRLRFLAVVRITSQILAGNIEFAKGDIRYRFYDLEEFISCGEEGAQGYSVDDARRPKER